VALYKILLVEDNPGDVLLLQQALEMRDVPCIVEVAGDGQKAITMVRDRAGAGGGSLPDLIVLDVNLPKHGGSEVLEQIRGVPALSSVPVIMFTSSSSPVDQQRATELGANLYLQKPSDLDDLLAVAEVIEEILTKPREKD
jgi:two-component system, chemotaxis family, response regulator Rcp1